MSGELAWVGSITEDDLQALNALEVRKVRLLMLFVAMGKGLAPAKPNKRGARPKRRPGAGGRGARRGNAKLDRVRAEWIRAWAASGYPQRAIAGAFNVSQPVVSGIVNGQRWRRA